MANIDDYIAQLSKEINRNGSGYSFIESNKMSEAIKYKETLKRFLMEYEQIYIQMLEFSSQ